MTEFRKPSICDHLARNEVIPIAFDLLNVDSRSLSSMNLKMFDILALWKLSLKEGTYFRPWVCPQFLGFWLFESFLLIKVFQVDCFSFELSPVIFPKLRLSFPCQRRSPKLPILHNFNSSGKPVRWFFQVFWLLIKKLKIHTDSSIPIFQMITFRKFAQGPWWFRDRFWLILWN